MRRGSNRVHRIFRRRAQLYFRSRSRRKLHIIRSITPFKRSHWPVSTPHHDPPAATQWASAPVLLHVLRADYLLSPSNSCFHSTIPLTVVIKSSAKPRETGDSRAAKLRSLEEHLHQHHEVSFQPRLHSTAMAYTKGYNGPFRSRTSLDRCRACAVWHCSTRSIPYPVLARRSRSWME